MKVLVGRCVLVLVVVAIPVVGTLMLQSRSDGTHRPAKKPAGPAFVPPPLYSGDPEPGLTFRLQNGVVTDVRAFRRLALFVPEDRPASDFLAPGAFAATFKGRLRIPTRDRYRFTFLGTGSFELLVDGESVLRADGTVGAVTGKASRLKKGEHEIVARYESPETGAAVLRVYWECSEIPREPIPPGAIGHDASPSLAQYGRLRLGRSIAEESRCGACHEKADRGAMVPPLVDAGSRMKQSWMARWILDPKALRPTAHMPRLLGGSGSGAGTAHSGTAQSDAVDIAAYLASLGTPAAPPSFGDDDVQVGGEIFADLGCIACHTLPGHEDPSTVGGRIPLGFVAAKWHPAALIEFLRAPSKTHDMPDFGLTEDRALALAAFVLDAAKSTRVPPVTGGDVARGKALVIEHGCAACHGMGVQSAVQAPSEAFANSGSVQCSFADYGFDESQAGALAEFLPRRVPGHRTATEAARRALVAQRCANCHGFDGASPLLLDAYEETRSLLGEDPEGVPLRFPPDLTFAGGKLRTEWMRGWLDGSIEEGPRPWLRFRMPRYPMDLVPLARGLAHGEGYGATETGSKPSLIDGTLVTADSLGGTFDPAPAPPEELRELGARLVPRAGGLGCIQCHGVADRPAEEVFEAPGIDLALTPTRLRKEYYHRWMRDPRRIDPETKMTRFADDDGYTGLDGVLSGLGVAQFEALWRYLETLAK